MPRLRSAPPVPAAPTVPGNARRPRPIALLAGALLLPLAACDDSRGVNPAPEVTAFALLFDTDGDGVTNAGDELRLTFTQALDVGDLLASDFELARAGDSLGAAVPGDPGSVDPVFAAGPDKTQVTIVLGTDPRLQARQLFDGTSSASGIDVSAMLQAGVLASQSTGIDALPGTAADVAPGFAPAPGTLVPGVAVTCVATGDLDDDGLVDAVLGVLGAPDRVLLGDAQDGLVEASETLAATSTRSVALGDLDGDGCLDLAQGNDGGQSNRIAMNDGAGRFADSQQNLGGESTQAIALADADLDGDLDLFAGNLGAEHLWLNDGTGGFALDFQNLLGFATTSVAFADLDRDGDPDLVVGNRGAEPDFVLANDGTGRFSPGAILDGVDTRALAVVDVDGDGDADVVAGSGGGASRLWLNAGGFVFADGGPLLSDRPTRALAAADLDASGGVDLVEGLDGPRGAAVWLQLRDGSFADATGDATGVDASAVTLADFDGDGDDDLLVAGAGGARLARGSLSASFGTPVYDLALPALSAGDTSALASGDLNGDGLADAVEGLGGGAGGEPNRVWLAELAPAEPAAAPPAVDGGERARGIVLVDSQQSLGAGRTTALALADLDRDGDLDLVEANRDGDAERAYANDGSGELLPASASLGAADARALAVGDLDGDGFADVVVGVDGARNVLRPNAGIDGVLAFAAPVLFGVAARTSALALADVDLDGDLDLVEGIREGADRVWRNAGGGSLTAGPLLPASEERETLALALDDLDGDGAPDVLAGVAGAPAALAFGRGDGTFEDADVALPASDDALAVLLADVDADGVLDAFVGSEGALALLTFDRAPEDGDTALTVAATALPAEAGLRALTAGDFDRDGDVDLLTGNDGAASRLLPAR